MRDKGPTAPGLPDLPPLPTHCKVAVVIPCRNEEEYIERCVRSLVESDRTGIELSVRVVDGRSDDGTRAIIQAISREHPEVELIDNPERTTPVALNRGLKRGGYDVAIILGAHAEVDGAFLRGNVEVLRKDASVGCAGGIIENVYEGPVAKRIGAAMAHPFGVGSAHFRTGARDGYVDTVAFGCYRKEVFQQVGFFDEDLVRNQDDEFNYRVTKAGYRIYLDKRIRSRYYVRASYPRLFEQYEQYGFWKVFVNKKHKAVTTLRQLVPALWVAFVLAGMTLSGLSTSIGVVFGVGALAYFTVATYSVVKVSGDRADIPGILSAFIVLHAAYGAGYLRGVLELILLRRSPKASDHLLTRGAPGAERDTVARLIGLHGVFGAFVLLALPWSLSLWPKAAPAFMAVAILLLVAHHWKRDGRNLPSIWEPLFWGGILYLVHVVGMAWTTDLAFGWFDLEVKSALLLLPLLFWAIPKDARGGGGLLLTVFVAGVTMSMVVSLLAAACRMVHIYLTVQGTLVLGSTSVEFFSDHLSLFMHPSYAAMYACFALACLLYRRADRPPISAIAINMVAVILFASKIGWLVLVLLALIMSARYGRSAIRRPRILIPLVITGTVFLAYAATSPFMREKLQQVRTGFVPGEPEQDATGSSEVRRLVWRSGGDVLANTWPWGTGTGDVKNELVADYHAKGYLYPETLRLNAHGQFLQTGVALGLLGLGVLLLLFFAPLASSVQRRDPLLLLFLVILLLNWTVESMLEVQAGVLFFAVMAFALATRSMAKG